MFVFKTVVLLASSHPVAFVQSKLSQDNKALVSIPEGEPVNPEPATPISKAPSTSDDTITSAAAAASIDTTAIIQSFKPEPSDPAVSSSSQQVPYDPDQEQTINSETLHALVEQLRPPPSPAQSLEQIVIIRTVDTAENNAAQQWSSFKSSWNWS